MTTQTTPKPTNSSHSKWRLAALLTALTSLGVLLASCHDGAGTAIWSCC